MIARAMSEDELLSHVMDLAGALGYRRHHDRPSQNRRGKWSTAIQGDPGFPDVVLANPRTGSVFIAELKTEAGKTSPEQDLWFEAFGIYAPGLGHLWTPTDWLDGSIEKILIGDFS